MKVKVSLGLLSLAVLATAAGLHERSGFAQDALAEPSPDAGPRAAEGLTVLTTPAAETQLGIADAPAEAAPDLFGVASTVQHREPSLQQAAAAVHGAQDDEARNTASERLQQLLHKTFDSDMQRREQELVRIEQRLQTLREQHARRMEKKDEIIELQTRVLLNEAEGLGFHSGPDAILGLEDAARPPVAVFSRSALSSDYLRPATIVPGQAPAPSVPRPGAKPAPPRR